MGNSANNGVPTWAKMLIAVAIATAGAVAWIEARVGDEAGIRRGADIRLEQKMDVQQQRIEDKLDDIQIFIMENN